MQIRHAMPFLAVFALVACGEEQTAEAPTTPTAPEVAVVPTPAEPVAPTEPAPVAPAAPTVATAPTPAAPVETAPPVAAAPGAATDVTGATSPTAPVAGATALERYAGRELTAGPVTLRLNPDQTFVMLGEQGQQRVEGRYAFEDGILTFSDPAGDVGAADFPMRCRVEEVGEGFVLRSTEDSCTRLNNLTFRPAA